MFIQYFQTSGIENSCQTLRDLISTSLPPSQASNRDEIQFEKNEVIYFEELTQMKFKVFWHVQDAWL